ncbi:MAG: VIT1/CCC1 family protein [Bifidobacteriaceae bacterium]|jgi:VIT1/CCC1 family predicted Fe2+/Mn2+ transporter|nr:VIT1/CCC1 family protein [Bifidobacteriaceae bacterium]
MSAADPSRAQIRRWRSNLADERAESATYSALAERRTGEERAILLQLAEAEERHAAHWSALLGHKAEPNPRRGPATWLLGVLARRFGFVFALAMAGRAEARSRYATDPDAPAWMAADEAIHAEVVRGLAERGRARLSGPFRAAVFGAGDGLVSNLSLVLGVGATGVSPTVVLVTGLAGLLSGALSMAAGEYVSVRSQRELLAASTPDPEARRAVAALDVDANELALVFRARGMDDAAATLRAEHTLSGLAAFADPSDAGAAANAGAEAVGTGARAALASFAFFAAGAIVPVIPYLCGLTGLGAVVLAAGLVGLALLAVGAGVGLASGASPGRKALRQLLIGYGAAAVTYLLGSAFNVAAG